MNRTEDALSEDQRRRRAEAWRLIEGARALWDAGRFHETEEPYRRGLALLEEVWGGDHAETAAALHNVAGLCYVQGKYAEAEAHYRRAARILEEAHGPSDPRAADEYYWLAKTLFGQERYEEAEGAYLRALALLERAYGPEDPRAAECLTGLGHLRYYVGRYAEAESPYLRALALRERAHGPDHPLVADALLGLASLYHHGRGVSGDAEPFYRRAASIAERTHPDDKYFAECLYRLALFLGESGRAVEAGPLYERAMRVLDAAADPEDPDARWMRTGYAEYLRAAGRADEADALEAGFEERDAYDETLREKIKRREAAFGPEHPETAEPVYDLANSLRYDGRDEEAELLYLRALSIWEGAGERERAAGCLNMLAGIRRHQGRLDEAGALLDRADALLENTTAGPTREHGRALENRAMLQAERGDFEGAEALYLRAVAAYEACLAEESYGFVEALYRLAIFYGDQERYAESEAVLGRLIPLAERSAEMADLEISDFHSYLAHVLRAQGRETEAAEADARAEELRRRDEASDV
ncbi:MAG TPA: tetratricopeptide repeat protein [Pyrinomonadaceae bacterium]|nr:tetratricopeptide repeat protein [Pyrinomonadaceae bacterium]